MGRQLRRALELAGLALLLLAAVALGAGPKKGATYAGALAHGGETITLKVAKNGKTVTANVLAPPLYCQGGGGPTRQIAKPAPISGRGSFSGSIAYEFTLTHKVTSKLYFSGKFSGKSARGTARSEFGVGLTPQQRTSLAGCNGSTSFTAKAK